MMIKGFERYNDDLDIKKTHRQIVNCDHYFRLKKFVKIEA